MRTTKHPAIIRMKKLRGWSAVGSSAGHTWRTAAVAHADASKTHLNEDWRDAASPAALRKALEERLGLASIRAKNPVLAIEYLITAPHEAFEENGGPVAWRAYFEDALTWIEKRHGRDNVAGVNIQMDETAPHMVAYVCPLIHREATTRKRSVLSSRDPETGGQKRELREYPVPAHVALSANHFVGSRHKLATLQSSFATEVAERHGLRRGIERSALRHVELKNYHDALVRGIQQRLAVDPEILKRQGGLLSRETPEEAAVRVAGMLHEQVEALMAKAATAELDRKRAQEWERTAANAQADRRSEEEAHRNSRQELESLIGGLSSGQVEKVREYRKRILDKRAELKKQREIEEGERQARHIDSLVANLRYMSPQEVVDLPEQERHELWHELLRRDDSEIDRLMESGLFEPDGTPRTDRLKGGGTSLADLPQPTPSAWQEPTR